MRRIKLRIIKHKTARRGRRGGIHAVRRLLNVGADDLVPTAGDGSLVGVDFLERREVAFS